MSIPVPLEGFGGGGGAGSGGTLTVTAPAGVSATVRKDGKSKTKTAGTDGIVVFKGLEAGVWTVTITDGSETASQVVDITTDYSIAITFNSIPAFTYDGEYEIVDDDDNPIDTSNRNWKIRFLTSGTLVFTNLNGAAEGIDVFCVGGGGSGGQWCNGGSDGGGGGGGYTVTSRRKTVSLNTQYKIIIGAGGTSNTFGNVPGSAGGKSMAFDLTANGGSGGGAWDSSPQCVGGAGGSGGGSGSSDGITGGAGGSDGGDGGSKYSSGGKGQGTTTREFGESTGSLYAGGGSGSRNTSAAAGGGAAAGRSANANTGGGGGAGYNEGTDHENGYTKAGAGGSGIVIIRNAR